MQISGKANFFKFVKQLIEQEAVKCHEFDLLLESGGAVKRTEMTARQLAIEHATELLLQGIGTPEDFLARVSFSQPGLFDDFNISGICNVPGEHMDNDNDLFDADPSNAFGSQIARQPSTLRDAFDGSQPSTSRDAFDGSQPSTSRDAIADTVSIVRTPTRRRTRFASNELDPDYVAPESLSPTPTQTITTRRHAKSTNSTPPQLSMRVAPIQPPPRRRSNRCNICTDSEHLVAMVPCGHIYMCEICADHWAATGLNTHLEKGGNEDTFKPLCPMCNYPYESHMRVHIS